MNVKIFEYTSEHLERVEDFRAQSFVEGNDSLSREKFNPDTLDGKLWLCEIDGELASISAVEASYYTGDPHIAARVCRYHILKRFRHSHCGFRMLEHQIAWAWQQGYQVLYWTHDIHNRSLNAMYQHKRRMLDKEAKAWFEADWYKKVQLDQRLLFRVSEKSDFLQYVYVLKNDSSFVWNPPQSVLWYPHDGEIKVTNREVINAATGIV